MSINRWRWAFQILIVAAVLSATAASAQTTPVRGRKAVTPASMLQRKDTVETVKPESFDDMARRVDSLRFIVVYNAELLEKDLSAKVTWIYVMLGVMIVASIAMYWALKQVQRGREDMEERLSGQFSSTLAQLESQIKAVSERVDLYHPKPTTRRPRKKS